MSHIGRLRTTRLYVEMRKLASLSCNSKTRDEHQVKPWKLRLIDNSERKMILCKAILQGTRVF